MAIGTPVSNKFQIGNAEIRLGPMTLANKLRQEHSMGLLQSATVTFSQESVDLEGGLPKTLIDTVITKTNVTVSAQAYEYSRKNIRTYINLGAESGSVSEYAGSVTTAYTAGTTATETIVTDIDPALITVGDMLVFYEQSSPEKVSVVQVTAKSGTTSATVTIDGTKTPVLFNLPVGAKVYKANQLGLGASSATNYFSMDVVGVDHNSGKPMGFHFWKVAISGGMEFSFSNDNFSVVPVTFKVLQPSATEFASGGSLVHLAGIIPTHPYGFYFSG